MFINCTNVEIRRILKISLTLKPLFGQRWKLRLRQAMTDLGPQKMVAILGLYLRSLNSKFSALVIYTLPFRVT